MFQEQYTQPFVHLKILKECEKFVEDNKDKEHDYFTYRDALHLGTKLINSLLESHKEFDEAVRSELEKYPNEGSEIEQACFMYKFNQKEIVLELDIKAQEILDRLEEIRLNNQR